MRKSRANFEVSLSAKTVEVVCEGLKRTKSVFSSLRSSGVGTSLPETVHSAYSLTCLQSDTPLITAVGVIDSPTIYGSGRPLLGQPDARGTCSVRGSLLRRWISESAARPASASRYRLMLADWNWEELRPPLQVSHIDQQ